MATVRDYYVLTKPGIIYGNVFHGLAGSLFAIAAVGHGWDALLWVAAGVALVIASACVTNNLTDRKLDIHMARTKKRPSVTGSIDSRSGAIYAILLGLLGFSVLALHVGWLVALLGGIAYIWYTVLYAYAKRLSPLGTLVGTVPGALPIVAGYVAVTGSLDLAAVLLGLVLVAWQMVHFYAISIFRKDEYTKASVPVISTVRTFEQVRRSMMVWLVVYLLLISLLAVTNAISLAPVLVLLAGGAYWLVTTSSSAEIPVKWARKVFGASLILSILTVVSGAIAIVVA